MSCRFLSFCILKCIAILVAVFISAAPSFASAGGGLADYLGKVSAGELLPGADRLGEPEGEPKMAPAYKGSELIGYVYLNSDVTPSVGYSGKPIRILIGLDKTGIVRGLKLVEHKEPIVLVGIPETTIIDVLNGQIGRDMARIASGAEKPQQVEIVSGATVTVLVMGDSVVRSAVKLIRAGRLAGVKPPVTAQTQIARKVDMAQTKSLDWPTLLGDGSIRRLTLAVGEVTKAFADTNHAEAAAAVENSDPSANFITLYVAPVSVPSIGISLLGKDGYERLKTRLKPGQQALLIAGEGLYSFKGSGYVRGGIFDRIELMQDGQGVRFHDRDHTRLGAVMAEGGPDLPEIALFRIPSEFSFDVTQPFDIQLLVQRAYGTRSKATVSFDLSYALPGTYLLPSEQVKPQVQNATVAEQEAVEIPLWVQMWEMNRFSIAVTLVALIVLTLIFFFQDILVKRPVLHERVRIAYLAFTLFWLGWYVNAQLSVVNVFTFANALISGFNWEFFLAAPIIFIIWASVAASLLFWGRGPFCGWLCPFGALQELTNKLARFLKFPQIELPWGLHERLWPIKYMIFLGLFGLSLHSLALAEQMAEVEPFKTAIILKFVRQWPFVVFALALLAAGLFVERFYCRYLCPLGAALAIPGRLRMFEWLRRWRECGAPCQRCAVECPVQSIHPEGHINVNECIYCMNCQQLYHDDQRCPHMIKVRTKREKFEALSTPSMIGKGKSATLFTRNGVSAGPDRTEA